MTATPIDPIEPAPEPSPAPAPEEGPVVAEPTPVCAYIWATYGIISGTVYWGDTEHVCALDEMHAGDHMCPCAEEYEPTPPPPTICPEA